jgi:transcriptional regulator with XRE-family HTH domain
MSMHLGVREVARSLGVSPTAVSQWERGQRAPRGDRAVAFAELLGLMNELAS